MKDFRELSVWTKSHALAIKVYRATANFTREELLRVDSLRGLSDDKTIASPKNIILRCLNR